MPELCSNLNERQEQVEQLLKIIALLESENEQLRIARREAEVEQERLYKVALQRQTEVDARINPVTSEVGSLDFTANVESLTPLLNPVTAEPESHPDIMSRAPPVLIVEIPGDCADCAGRYELVHSLCYSGYPVWRQFDGEHHIFSSLEGMLIIGMVESFDTACNDGAIASVMPHEGTLPQHVSRWQRDDALTDWIEDEDIVVRLPTPSLSCASDSDDIGDDDDSESSVVGPLRQRSTTLYNFPPPEEFLSSKFRRGVTT